MFEQHIDYIANYNNLKKQLAQINLVQKQNLLIQQQQQLTELNQRFKLIHSATHKFKGRLYKLVLANKELQHPDRLLQRIFSQRKDKIDQLTENIYQLEQTIVSIEDEIEQLKAKLNRIKMKLEKFKILPELIDDEFLHSF